MDPYNLSPAHGQRNAMVGSISTRNGGLHHDKTSGENIKTLRMLAQPMQHQQKSPSVLMMVPPARTIQPPASIINQGEKVHRSLSHNTDQHKKSSSTFPNAVPSSHANFGSQYTDNECDFSVHSFSTAGLNESVSQFQDETALYDADLAAVENHGKKASTKQTCSLNLNSEQRSSSNANLYNKSNNGKIHGKDVMNKRRKIKLGAALLVGVAIICVVVGAVVAVSGSNTANIATDDFENQSVKVDRPTRLNEVLSFIADRGYTSRETLSDTSSPQYIAAKWIADYDARIVALEKKGEFRDRYVLATLYHATQGKQWRYNINWMSSYEACMWSSTWPTASGQPIKVGVVCQDRSNVVERIFLPSMEMAGTLPSELGLLDGLQVLDMYKNKLKGKIPSELQNLTKLRSLLLHNNALTGSIPQWLPQSTKLETLDLAVNNLHGQLPANLHLLTSLRSLNFENNQLTGGIDPLHGLVSLQFLALGSNQLTGSLSEELLSTCPVLSDLDLSDNLLTGTLPNMLFAHKPLLVLDLHNNDFEGHLPSIVDLESSIQFIALHKNRLSGNIDHRVTAIVTLQHLDLSHNEFVGTLPSEMVDLYNLKYLFLAFNPKLTPGPIPIEWGTRMTQLKDFSLQATRRTGVIPSELGTMSSLVLLDLAGNELQGRIPSEIGNLRNMKFLVLNNNSLTGTIPESFANSQSLTKVIMDHNDLTGGAKHICTPRLPNLLEFISDCQEVTCSCCTHCCVDGESCNEQEWFAQQDPLMQYQYTRVAYKFNEMDVIYPVSEAKGIVQHYDKYGVHGGVRHRKQ